MFPNGPLILCCIWKHFTWHDTQNTVKSHDSPVARLSFFEVCHKKCKLMIPDVWVCACMYVCVGVCVCGLLMKCVLKRLILLHFQVQNLSWVDIQHSSTCHYGGLQRRHPKASEGLQWLGISWYVTWPCLQCCARQWMLDCTIHVTVSHKTSLK